MLSSRGACSLLPRMSHGGGQHGWLLWVVWPGRRGHGPCGATRVARTCSASEGGRGRLLRQRLVHPWMGAWGPPSALGGGVGGEGSHAGAAGALHRNQV